MDINDEVIVDSSTDNDSSDEEDELHRVNGRIDVRHSAADFIANARVKCVATREGVRQSIKNCELVLKARTTHLKSCVVEFLEETNMQNNPAAARLLNQFDVESPFKSWKSNEGQINAVKSYYDYISPSPILLGHRVDRINVGDNEFQQVPVRETFQYVSIKEILKMVSRKQTVMEYVHNLRPSVDGSLNCYTDGEHFANHPFFERFPDAFQLGLYYDDIGTSCPTGSKTGIHLLPYFACNILNIPPYLNSVFGGYHTIALAHKQDIDKYGFRPVLQNFLDECRQLESDEGVEIYIGKDQVVQRACVCALLGDTKAVHELLGFLAPGARHFCRLCMISRPQLHEGVTVAQPRTQNLHAGHLEENAANPARSLHNGVQSNSCLHDLRYFHATTNYCLDSMHDVLSGVAEWEIKLVLRELSRHRAYFRPVDLNRRIIAFNYGSTDRCNKPSANFTTQALDAASTKHNLVQTSAQTMCLLKVLPFLLDHLGDTPEQHDHITLLLKLYKILQIVRAPRLAWTTLPHLEDLIEDHRRLFRELFPLENPINKHHHMEHYAQCIRQMGPLEQFNCMRAEAAMRPLKRHIVTCNSYRNVCKTAAEYTQISQSMRWGSTDPNVISKYEFKSAKVPTPVFECRTAEILTDRGFDDNDIIHKLKTVSVFGRDYKINTFVVIRKGAQNPDGMEAFGKIVGIIAANDDEDVWLEIEEWVTEYEAERFNAFVVREPRQPVIHLFDPLELPNHSTISPLRDYSTANIYLVLRHVIE